MATIFSSEWEGTGILDSSTWDSEGGTTGGLTVATDQALQNTHALKYTGNGGNSDYLNKSISAVGTCGVRVGLRINSMSTAVSMVSIRDDNSVGDMVYVTADGNGNIYVVNNANSQHVGSDFAGSLNTWYQVEVLFVNGTSIKWKVWESTGNTLVHTEQTTSIGVSAHDCNKIVAGFIGSPGGSNTLWFDSFVADNAAYPGPFVSGGGPTANWLIRGFWWQPPYPCGGR